MCTSHNTLRIEALASAAEEDIHSWVEARLGEKIGDLAGQGHLGRSRNEQAVTALRLWIRGACDRLRASTAALVTALRDQGVAGADVAMSIITEGLLPLTRIDAKVSRAFFRTLNLISSPNAVMSDPDLTARVLAYWQTRDTRPPVAPVGPTRDELIDALSALAVPG